MSRVRAFPLGAAVTLEELDADPHPALARLRAREPVSWLPALDGWMITSHRLAAAAMRDAEAFTVDDVRFTTAQVVGPSMLSLDGEEHRRHRAPFAAPLRPRAVSDRFAGPVSTEAEALIDGLAPSGAGELRRSFAGPLAAITVARALGLDPGETPTVLAWYDVIVAAVTELTAGAELPGDARRAFAGLSARLRTVIDGATEDSLLAAAAAQSDLEADQIIGNAAVLLFGGIETTEGMIANALLHLLERPDQLEAVRRDSSLVQAAIEESLRLEPAAAVVDRYAAREVNFGGAPIAPGDLVRISIAGANRDPAVFADPDEFRLVRSDRRHLAFASGPHVCVGVHLARLEARAAVTTAITRLPALRLDPERPSEVRGLVFRKPVRLDTLW